MPITRDPTVPAPADARESHNAAVDPEDAPGDGGEVMGSDDSAGECVEAEIRSHVDRLACLLDGTHSPATATAARARVQVLRQLTGLAAAATADAVSVLRRAGGIAADGASSTADWLKTNTGRSGRDAARVARLATDLADLPATRQALAAGRITDEAADALVQATRDGRIGTPDQVEATLVEVATTSSPEALRADIRDRQQAADAAAMLHDENRQHAVRDVRLVRRDTGMWRLTADLPDELGQTLRTALNAYDHPDPDGTPDDRRRRPGQRLADALSAMTDAVLDRGLAPATGGITRPHLSVIVHADTVSADLTRPDATDPTDPAAGPATDDPRWADLPGGDLPWGGKLSPQAVRRICCDAAVSRIVTTGDSQVLDVGRATRQWSGPQRRAVNARDRGCRGPHCTRPIAWTAVHHLQWWRHDGPTSVDNGLALCHHCHRLVHHHGWTVHHDLDTSTATWTSPDGHTIVTTPRRSPARPAATSATASDDLAADGATAPEAGGDPAPGGPTPTGPEAPTRPTTPTAPGRPGDRTRASQPRLDDTQPHTAGGIPRP